MNWFSQIFSPFLGAIGDYFKHKQELKATERQYEFQLKQAQFEADAARIARGDTIESDYDKLVLQQSMSTIIDEIMIMWVLGIVTCLFIPSLAPYAVAGFVQLETVPLWFQLIFVGCFIAKLGLRFLFSGRTLFGKEIK